MATSNQTVKLRLWKVASTDKAHQFSTTPNKGRDGEKIWIPRSQIIHVSNFGAEPGDLPECEVEMTEFIAEKKGLL